MSTALVAFNTVYRFLVSSCCGVDATTVKYIDNFNVNYNNYGIPRTTLVGSLLSGIEADGPAEGLDPLPLD